jgi:hypothetical protein
MIFRVLAEEVLESLLADLSSAVPIRQLTKIP